MLERRLFVHTEKSRVERRLQIKTNDVGSLSLKLRIIAGHMVAQTVRLQAMVSPNASNHHVGYS